MSELFLNIKTNLVGALFERPLLLHLKISKVKSIATRLRFTSFFGAELASTHDVRLRGGRLISKKFTPARQLFRHSSSAEIDLVNA